MADTLYNYSHFFWFYQILFIWKGKFTKFAIDKLCFTEFFRKNHICFIFITDGDMICKHTCCFRVVQKLSRFYCRFSLITFALASPMMALISSREASFIRFTLLNSFSNTVFVFSPMPLIVSSVDATCRLLRLSR